MISEEAALEKILAVVQPLAPRVVPLAAALDCFAAEELLAPLALPPFDNSAMDGYAVVAHACPNHARLNVVGEQPAGLDLRLMVKPGEAVRIFTGAPVPAGADAVVMQEDVLIEGSWIRLREAVCSGENIRRCGADVAAGQRILEKGDRITPQTIALLAAEGIGSLQVGGSVRAALISTGDELASAGEALQSGQIYESNTALLRALLTKIGVELTSSTRCGDRADEIEAAVSVASDCDIMIITGGVSVGARDFVKDAIRNAGGTIDLWRVAVKPGKPFLFGQVGRCAIFGLPGNPISAFVTYLLFVRPALLRLMGASEKALTLPAIPARLEAEVRNPNERPHYVRGFFGDGTFLPIGLQESHALFGLSRSNSLLLVRPGETIEAGALVTVFTWD